MSSSHLNSLLRNRSGLSVLLLSASLIVPASPWIALPRAVKFGLYGLLILGSIVVLMPLKVQPTNRQRLVIFGFLYLYAIAAVRINEVMDASGRPTWWPSLAQMALTAAAILAVELIAVKVDVFLIRTALLVILVPSALRVLMSLDELGSYDLRRTFRVGDLSFDSYQQASSMLGLSALCVASAARTADRAGRRVALWCLCAVLTFGVLDSQARGEALAYFFCIVLLISPRFAVILLPVGLSAVQFLARAIDSPLASRFSNFGDAVGVRGGLVGQAFELLGDRPWYLVVGGGANAFQSNLELELGSYPHNVFVEAIVIGGIPLFVWFVLAFVGPTAKALVRLVAGNATESERFAVALSVYFLLIAAKSGSLVFIPAAPILLLLNKYLAQQHRVRSLSRSVSDDERAVAGHELSRSPLGLRTN